MLCRIFFSLLISLQDFFSSKKGHVFTYTKCIYIYIVVIAVIVLIWSCKALKCCKLYKIIIAYIERESLFNTRISLPVTLTGSEKGLIKCEALRLLRTNSSAKSFYENIYNFKKRLRARGYPHNLIEKITSEVKFTERKSALQKNNEVRKKILPFVTTYHPALQNLKNILMSKWHLIQDQPLLREIYNEPPIISYKRAKSLGDILVRAKL